MGCNIYFFLEHVTSLSEKSLEHTAQRNCQRSDFSAETRMECEMTWFFYRLWGTNSKEQVLGSSLPVGLGLCTFQDVRASPASLGAWLAGLAVAGGKRG